MVGNGGTAGSLTASGTLGVANAAVLAFNRSGVTDLGAVAGTGTVRVDGGALRLTATLPDVTTVSVLNGGTLQIADGAVNRINTNATLSVANGGTLTLEDAPVFDDEHQGGVNAVVPVVPIDGWLVHQASA